MTEKNKTTIQLTTIWMDKAKVMDEIEKHFSFLADIFPSFHVYLS